MRLGMGLGLGNLLSGGPITGMSNKYSFNFDGSDDYLETQSKLGISGNDAFSMSAWIKLDHIDAVQVVIFGGVVSTNLENLLYISSSNKVGWNNQGTNDFQNSSGTSLSADTWYHVAVTFNGSDTVKVYLNGSLDGSKTDITGDVNITDSNYMVGKRTDGLHFDGCIDEVGIWNTELSASDIAKIASKPSDLSKASSYDTDRTSNLKLWLRAGDKVLPEEDTSIARSDFYTDFDGSNDYVSVADDSSLALTTALSVSGWVNFASVSGSKTIAGHFDYPNNQRSWSLAWLDDTTNYLRFFVSGDGSSFKYNRYAWTPTVGQWYHLTATYNAGTTKLYIDGSAVTVDADSSQPTSLHNSTGALFIGAVGNSSTNADKMEGKLSSVSLYQTTLDAQTIKQFAKSRFTPMRNNRFSVVDFDGTNDHIVVSDDDALDVSGTSDYTLIGWVKADVDIASDTFNVANKYSTNAGWMLSVTTTNNLRWETGDGSAIDTTKSANNSYPETVGSWQHIGVTGGGGGKAKLYLNGNELGSLVTDDNHDTIATNTADMLIGTAPGAGSGFWNGAISSISIYNVAKSAEEIYAIYQQGITYDESSLSGLVGYWRMGDDTSKAYPTIADSSSNSNDGTITNGASNDIQQQMVAGWDLGAFESSSEELGGSLITTPNSASAWGANQASKDDATIDGRSGVRAEETSTGDRGRIDRTLSIDNNVPYQLSGYVYKYSSYNGNSATNKNWHLVFGTDTTESTYPDVSSDTIKLSVTSYDTWEYISFNIIARSGSNFYLLPSERINSHIGTMIFSDIALKKVLQSEVSDTYPAIIDVNEPVLGVDLITNGDLESSSSSPTMNSVAFTYYNGSGARSTDFSNGGSHSYKFTGGDQNDHNAKIIPNDSSLVGKILSVSVDVYTPTSGGSSGNIDLRVINHAGGASTLESTSTKDAWVNLSGVFVYDGTSAQPINIQWFTADSVMYIDNLSIKQILGNVGTMTNQASDDLVYSSVLPDQSFLTGVNSAYNFIDLDGSNEYIDCGNGTSLQITKGFTISCWAKLDSSASNGTLYIIAGKDASYKGWNLQRSTANKIIFYAETGTPSNLSDIATSSSTITDSNWHHYVGVFHGDGSTQSKIYIDGSDVTSNSGSTFSTMTDSGGNMHLGKSPRQTSYGWYGSISGTAIWNKALSATEVSAIYTLGRHGNLLDSYADNLVGLWSMSSLDAKTGLSDVGNGTIYDRSGNSNHGTPTNTESADLKSSPNAEPNGYAKGDTNRSTTTP